MNIRYFGFNSFGLKLHHVVMSTGGNLKQPNLNIGVSLLCKMQVQAPQHSSTWVKYVSDSGLTSDPAQVSESSITYSVVVAGSANNEVVTFMMQYAFRNAKVMDKKSEVQLGHFDVYNENNNAKHKLSTSAGIGIAFSVFLAFLIAVAMFSGAITAYMKRTSIAEYIETQRVTRRLAKLAKLNAASNTITEVTITTSGFTEDTISLSGRESLDNTISTSGANTTSVSGNVADTQETGKLKARGDFSKSTKKTGSPNAITQRRQNIIDNINTRHQKLLSGIKKTRFASQLEDRIKYLDDIYKNPSYSDV